MARTHVAVYGILRSDLWELRHPGFEPIMAEFADLVGPCRIPGEMYSVGAFPALVPGEGAVVGQLWRVRRGMEDLTFKTLDQIESYRPHDEENSMYLRRKIRLKEPRRMRAFCYFWNEQPFGMRRVPSGDWKYHESLDPWDRIREEAS